MARPSWHESHPISLWVDPEVTLQVRRLLQGDDLLKFTLRVTIGWPPEEFLRYDYPHDKKGLHVHRSWVPGEPWAPVPGTPRDMDHALDMAIDHLSEHLPDLLEEWRGH